MYIGSFYCNALSMYKNPDKQIDIVLGDLSEVYDEDFGGWLTVDHSENGEPLFGLYCPKAYIKGDIFLPGFATEEFVTNITEPMDSKIFNTVEGLMITPSNPNANGLYIGKGAIGYYDNGSFKTYMGIGVLDGFEIGVFYLQGAGVHGLAWNGRDLSIDGNIHMHSGTIKWGAVNHPVITFDEIADKPELLTSEELTTVLGQDYIISGKIYANQVTAGTLSGMTLWTHVNDGVIGQKGVLSNSTLQLKWEISDDAPEPRALAWTQLVATTGSIQFSNRLNYTEQTEVASYGRTGLSIESWMLLNGDNVLEQSMSVTKDGIVKKVYSYDELGNPSSTELGVSWSNHSHDEFASFATHEDVTSSVQEGLQGVEQDVSNIQNLFSNGYSGYFEVLSNGDSLGITVENGLITNVDTV